MAADVAAPVKMAALANKARARDKWLGTRQVIRIGPQT